jgi:hypothetical protein
MAKMPADEAAAARHQHLFPGNSIGQLHRRRHGK